MAFWGRVLFHEIKQYNITALKRSGMINNAPGISLHPECHYVLASQGNTYPHFWTTGAAAEAFFH